MDKGYPDRNGYLTLYPKLRYHQSQFQNEHPRNAQAAFNRAHSSLRSCIGRSFGVLKQKWKMLNRMQKFIVETQIQIIVVTFALHNYIRINESIDPIIQVPEQYPNFIPSNELCEGTSPSEESRRGRPSTMKETRNIIATSLWRDRR